MFKVAILGCENSHANSFLGQLRDGRHPDMTVVGVYSDEEEACKKLNAEFGVHIMETYDELVGKVDGLMITARHGDNHYKYAKPYLASGIPMFIDKPITCDGNEAVEFMREAKKYGVRLCGGSSCKYLPGVTEMAKEVAQGTYMLSEGKRALYYERARKARHAIRARLDEILGEFDVILTPTTPTAAFRFGTSLTPTQRRRADLCAVYASLAGLPAVTIPFGKDADGMPTGIQLTAAPFAEELLLRVSTLLEEVRP